MTRKEASQILDDYDINFEGHTAEVIAEAFDVAFEALEQEPCENAISRREAILQIQRHGVGCFDEEEFTPEESERFVIGMLNKLPPVTPQPKTNQEYIATLSPVEFWKKIQWLQKEYGKRYTDSYQAIIEWLSAKRSDKEC